MMVAALGATNISAGIGGVFALLSVLIAFLLSAHHRYVALQSVLAMAIIGGVLEFWLASRKGDHGVGLLCKLQTNQSQRRRADGRGRACS